MNHRDAQSAWSDDPRDPGAHAHMAVCEACRQFVRAQQALDVHLAIERDEALRPGFDTRFQARLAAARQGPPRHAWPGWAWASALALGLALAVTLPMLRLASPMPQGEMALAPDLELVQENVDMLRQLPDLEDTALARRLPADILPEALR